MIIISGYQGVGKSTFATTSHKEKFGREITCVDIESSNYDKTNPEWYKQYAQDIIAVKDVDVVFISSHQSLRDELDKLGVIFYFIIPHVNVKHGWTEMLAKRVQDSIGNDSEREKNIRALMSHILYYDKIIEELENAHPFMAEHKRPYETVIVVESPSDLKYLIYRLLDRIE